MILGILTLAVVGIAIIAFRKGWPRPFVITATASLYFNVFVLVVQSFEKVPSLHALAPTQKEPPFAIAQLALLILFVTITVLTTKRGRSRRIHA